MLSLGYVGAMSPRAHYLDGTCKTPSPHCRLQPAMHVAVLGNHPVPVNTHSLCEVVAVSATMPHSVRMAACHAGCARDGESTHTHTVKGGGTLSNHNVLPHRDSLQSPTGLIKKNVSFS